jgi:hypothetical protein
MQAICPDAFHTIIVLFVGFEGIGITELTTYLNFHNSSSRLIEEKMICDSTEGFTLQLCLLKILLADPEPSDNIVFVIFEWFLFD